eukprot:15334888-Ditylum_brightwellii.AAC.2
MFLGVSESLGGVMRRATYFSTGAILTIVARVAVTTVGLEEQLNSKLEQEEVLEFSLEEVEEVVLSLECLLLPLELFPLY